MMQAREEFLWEADSAALAASFLPWWALPAPPLGPEAAWGKVRVASAARSWTPWRANFLSLAETTAPPFAAAARAAPSISSLLISLLGREPRPPWDSAELSLCTPETSITPTTPPPIPPATSTSAAEDNSSTNQPYSAFRLIP